MVEERKRRSDFGHLVITNRDAFALRWIAEQFCISFDHLQKLLGRYAKAQTKNPDVLSISSTREIVQKWLTLELIEQPRKITSSYPTHIWLSRKGLSYLGLPYSYYQPKQSTIQHIYATNAIRFHVERLGIRWYPHRALIRDTQVRPQPDGEIRDVQTHSRIAVIVIEQPFHLDITLSDMLSALETIAQRKTAEGTGAIDLYTNIWCYAHVEAASTLQHELSMTTREPLSYLLAQKRVVFYGLDAQQLSQNDALQRHISTPDLSA